MVAGAVASVNRARGEAVHGGWRAHLGAAKGTCSDLAALFLACSPLLSYLAVVVTLAWPTKRWTTEMSTPASRRSDTEV
jgi:hypothetical protein